MTIMQALAQGGGHTVRGSEWRLRLHRKNADGVVKKLSPEMTDTVQPNDIIYVRESIF
jgi:polysaccharide export outer membrane protein